MITIDFEASCLPRHGRSYPIEVGVAGAGSVARSWLIKPHPRWSGWQWSDEAQSLHGITRDQLDRDGLAADIVLAQLTETIGGETAIADSHLDVYWMETLAAAVDRPAPIRIQHVTNVIDGLGASPDDIHRAKASADGAVSIHHRAGEDARWLARFIDTLKELAGAGRS